MYSRLSNQIVGHPHGQSRNYSGPEVGLEEVSPDRYWETPICPGIRNEVVPEWSATLTLRLFQGCPSLGRNPRLDHQNGSRTHQRARLDRDNSRTKC